MSSTSNCFPAIREVPNEASADYNPVDINRIVVPDVPDTVPDEGMDDTDINVNEKNKEDRIDSRIPEVVEGVGTSENENGVLSRDIKVEVPTNRLVYTVVYDTAKAAKRAKETSSGPIIKPVPDL